jgi:DNA modification methylase
MEGFFNLLQGDCLEALRNLPDASVQCCVTSPPYFGLRDYGHDGQIGLEETPDAYVAKLVTVFREVRRVLRDDGTCWLNLGDSYFSSTKGTGGSNPETSPKQAWKGAENGQVGYTVKLSAGELPIKPKDIIGIPWRVAFALQADGWWLRQDIIWHKPNPMPESVKDRCTKAHEYIFLLTKSARYFYDAEAVREPNANPALKECKKDWRERPCNGEWPSGTGGRMGSVSEGRNRRSVWTVATKPFAEAHFAVFPPDLIEPCVLAGSAPGDTVLDPFNGSGTTGLVALKHQRRYIGIELNPEYVAMSQRRLHEATKQKSLFSEVPNGL